MQEAACRFFTTENSWRGFDISSCKEGVTIWGGVWPLERKNAVLKSPDQKQISYTKNHFLLLLQKISN